MTIYNDENRKIISQLNIQPQFDFLVYNPGNHGKKACRSGGGAQNDGSRSPWLCGSCSE